MKRILFACFVFAIATTPAFAQGVFNREVGPFIYPNATSVGTVLRRLAEEEGFQIKQEGLPPIERTIHGQYKRMKLREFIDDVILPRIESSARMTDTVLIIYGPGVQVTEEMITAPVEETNSARRSGAVTGAPVLGGGCGVENFWLLPSPDGRNPPACLTAADVAEWHRKRRDRPGYNPCSYGDYPCAPSYPTAPILPVYHPEQVYTRTGLLHGGNYITGFHGSNYGYLPVMRGCTAGPSGRVKFKYVGNSNERVLWEMEFNGAIIGSIDQADSFFNESYFCVGDHEVTARKRGLGEVTRTYSVRLADLTEITVGDFLFCEDQPELQACKGRR